MKAAVIEEVNRLVVREIPEPSVGEYDAFCKILFGATCSGTDLSLLDGSLPFLSPLPTVLGHESIGRVLEVGPRVRYLREGDLVTRVGTPAVDGYSVTWGGFAEFGVAKDYRAMIEDGIDLDPWPDARRNRVLPEGTDPAAATMVITWRETLSYLTRMGMGPGKSLLVIGSGGNGLAYVAHAALLGGVGVAMIGSRDREEAARRAGASEYIDYRAEDLAERVAGACKNGYDLVLDAVGKNGAADLGLCFLKPGGTLAIYGLHDFGQCTINPLRSRGSFTFYNGDYDEAETHEQVMVLLGAGRLDPSIWLDLDHPFRLEQIGDALEAVRERRLVKALIKITE
jgi:D-arabinose 1-dehydrogenase-like Zn-dependent alcohol dehydrogenase